MFHSIIYIKLQIINFLLARMFTGSFTELKFWNKKTPSSQFLITAPGSLDNYFRTQKARINGGHLPIPVQFNTQILQQSLSCILSKKIRGVRLSPSSQLVLKNKVTFINKNTYDRYEMTIDNLFGHYLKYKLVELNKAFISDTLCNQIVKPFMRIYAAVIDKEYTIQCQENKIKKELNCIFENILRQNKYLCENTQPQFLRLQRYFTDTRMKTNQRVLEEADRVLSKMQLKQQQDEKVQDNRYKMRDFKNTYKNIKGEENKNKMLGKSTIGKPHMGKQFREASKKIKFKQLNETNEQFQSIDDSEDLCYQLGLLISDTDRILKPKQQNNYGFPNI